MDTPFNPMTLILLPIESISPEDFVKLSVFLQTNASVLDYELILTLIYKQVQLLKKKSKTSIGVERYFIQVVS